MIAQIDHGLQSNVKSSDSEHVDVCNQASPMNIYVPQFLVCYSSNNLDIVPADIVQYLKLCTIYDSICMYKMLANELPSF